MVFVPIATLKLADFFHLFTYVVGFGPWLLAPGFSLCKLTNFTTARIFQAKPITKSQLPKADLRIFQTKANCQLLIASC
jgi:hypothetical protein